MLLLLSTAYLLAVSQISISNTNQDDISEYYLEDNSPSNEPQSSATYVTLPSTDKKYFSPDTTPGVDDSVLYYFSIDEDKDYELNISAYYDPIDDFPGYHTNTFGAKSASYLMSNGTWLIIAVKSVNQGLNKGTWYGYKCFKHKMANSRINKG